ncbi:MAG: S41 family peptidase [Bacteroidota bacterium]|nr:S41 family peptidase [Bacteroidota bacterium]MEC7950831.1 S41 family peptidase [Bacteroidota bacterium]MED5318917.1 S41 family peptidase [Bacteroidota bacterium]HCL46390.1 peptidase S41 [Flavobacteriales bacterium]
MRRLLFLLGLPLVLVVVVAASVKDDYFEMSKQLEIMQSAFRELNLFYVDELAPGELMETGIKAMLAQLDPYTRYFPETKMEDVRFMQTGEYGGVGASIETRNGQTIVVDLLEGEPAEQAGLQLGDVMMRVNGRDLAGLDQNQIGDLLQGATGTDVTVDIQRPGTREILTFELQRQKVKVPDVPYQGMLSETTGYLALSSFTKTASFEVRKALMNLTDSLGAEHVVIDLRGNGGGLLREAIAMVNLFVGKGQEVVSTKGKTPDWNKSYKTRANALRPDLPIAILVDGKSASASEIVAGTLQDLDRGVVVGSESFGKGLVQQTKKLAYGTRMKVTVAKYYTPSGRCVQRLDYSHRDDEGEVHAMADSTLSIFHTANGREVLEGRGVLPDVEVPQPDLGYVLEGLLENGVLFDFAVQHRDALVAPADAIAFEVSDETWRSFVGFAQGLTDLPYASKTLEAFQALERTAEEELLDAPNAAALAALRAGLVANVSEDLERHRAEIERELAHELVVHLYNTSGEYRHGLAQDPVAQRAVKLLESKNYNEILQGPTDQK